MTSPIDRKHGMGWTRVLGALFAFVAVAVAVLAWAWPAAANEWRHRQHDRHQGGYYNFPPRVYYFYPPPVYYYPPPVYYYPPPRTYYYAPPLVYRQYPRRQHRSAGFSFFFFD